MILSSEVRQEVADVGKAMLGRRPDRVRDLARENAAFRALIDQFSRDPAQLLERLCQEVMDLLGAGSSGISLLRADADDGGIFYWPAIAGQWEGFVGGQMPRNASPCGVVCDSASTLLFQRPEAIFTAAAGVTPVMEDLLVAPFFIDGAPAGTVWAIHHDKQKKFDQEDARLLENLSHFASAAHQAALAEEALRELNETLEDRVSVALAERKVFSDVIDGSTAAVTALDVSYRIMAINKANVDAFERVFGKRPRLGDNFLDLFEDMPEHVDQQREMWARALLGEDFVVIQAFGDPTLDRRYFEVRFSSLRDTSGVLIGASSTSYDVTDRVHAEQQLEVAREQLRQSQKMEAVGQLTGGIAHDFNNLLTIIRSSTDFLRRDNLSEERRSRYINAISDTADRAAKLTSQLLAFARRQPLLPTVFDVSAQVDTISVLLRQLLGSRVTIDVAPCGRPCFTNADVGQFENALINLAVNARDAMDGEGRLTFQTVVVEEMPSVRGAKARPGRFVAVSVTDTGSGIGASELDSIFEPFFTTKEVGKGTGLGLSQVFGFSQQSGGDIAVSSVLGQGATFTLYLPVVQPSAAEKLVTSPQHGEDARSRNAHCILIVEDNKDVGVFSTELMNDLGYRTRWVASGHEALAALAENDLAYDLVFTDVIMPEMNGVDLARTIRTKYPGLPVVLTSGYSHVLVEGDHGFELVQKPYSVEALSRVLRKAILSRGS